MTHTPDSARPTTSPARPGRAPKHRAVAAREGATAAVFAFAAIPKITADPMAVAGFAMMGSKPTY